MGELQRINPFHCRLWRMHDRLREYVDERACASLIESFKAHGQKHPVLGRRLHGDEDGYKVELIYGARRLFAARHLAVDLLVELRQLDDRAALAEMDIENRVRADISPYERGRSYMQWLREGYFESQAELAKYLGISEAQVSRLLRFAELPAAVVDAFGSPHDIKEQWAVELAKRCSEHKHRDAVVRKARELKKTRGADPRVVYERLINSGDGRRLSRKSRDEVVRDEEGQPVMRIAVRSATVHLIIPRARVPGSTLRSFVERVRQVIGAQ